MNPKFQICGLQIKLTGFCRKYLILDNILVMNKIRFMCQQPKYSTMKDLMTTFDIQFVEACGLFFSG